MSSPDSVTLAFACPVAADALTPIRSGHYCQSCEQHVRDYSAMSDRPTGSSQCARMRSTGFI